MKGKRHTTKENNWVLGGSGRWRVLFGLMEVNRARRLKELERRNGELKNMLAESLLKNHVLEAVCEKNSEPGGAARSCATTDRYRDLFGAGVVPNLKLARSTFRYRAKAATERTRRPSSLRFTPTAYTVQAVPEPAALSLLIIPAAYFLLRRNGRRCATKN